MQNGIDDLPEINEAIPTENQKIHIRIKQRNGRKNTTTIEGLPPGLKLPLVLQEMKSKFHCNGCVQSDGSIMLFGDQRIPAKKFLVDNSITTETNILIHGY